MVMHHNTLPSPGGTELDPATAETIRHAQLVKFAPEEFHNQGRPNEAGECHVTVLCRKPGDTLRFSITSREQAQQSGKDAVWMDLGTGGVGAVWIVT